MQQTVHGRNQNARNCEHCGLKAHYGIEDRCRACNHPVSQWAPNVQRAALSSNVEALLERFGELGKSLDSANDRRRLQRLRRAIEEADVVLSIPLTFAHSFFAREDPLYAPYVAQVEAGIRAPAAFEYERIRLATDSLLYGTYGKDIVFAVLSLDGIGLPTYGSVHFVLIPATYIHRTTVLEENSFHLSRYQRDLDKPDFDKDTGISTAGLRVEGRLALWEHRGLLAAVKLYERLPPRLTRKALAKLLVERGDDRADDRFLEAHIFGGFNRQAVERIHISHRPGPAATKKHMIKQHFATDLGRMAEELEIPLV